LAFRRPCGDGVGLFGGRSAVEADLRLIGQGRAVGAIGAVIAND
jgi:hypothetical protein